MRGNSNRKGMGMKVTAAELLASDWPMSFCDPEEDGSPWMCYCFCGDISGANFSVSCACWRLANGSCLIKVSGDLDAGTRRRIAEHIRDHNGWTETAEFVIEIPE